MSFPFPRQFLTPSGSRTISVDPVGTALSIDSAHTGTASGLSAPTLTVSSTEAPTTATAIASPSFTPANNNNSGTLNIGAIIGIIVGLFVLLAAALIVFMTIRHRKRRKGSRARALSSTRKSRPRHHDDSNPAEMQMRATNLAKTASIRDSNAPVDQNPFLSLNSSRALVLEDQVAATLDNTTQQPFGLGDTRGLVAQPSTRSAGSSHIPNPFASANTSPSHSPSASHTSTYSSHAPSLTPAAMASFTQHTPQYTHTSAVTASSASDYQYPLPSPTDESPPPKVVEVQKSAAPPTSARLVRKHSTKPAEEARSRELKAMQDLISALDARAPSKKAPPSAFNLKIDTNTKHEKSRLSMAEDLVTPGGHSIQEEDDALKYDHNGNRYAHPNTSDDQENFPLPPAEVFRAALSPGGGQGKVDKGKRKEKTPNPFQD